ncbi:MAG: hypothetical protein WCQ72_00030 [Eubacteriales bacterium]
MSRYAADGDSPRHDFADSDIRINAANISAVCTELRCAAIRSHAHLSDYADILLRARSDDTEEEDDADGAPVIKTAVCDSMRELYRSTFLAEMKPDGDARFAGLYLTVELCREIAARTRGAGAAAQLRERAGRGAGSLVCYLRNSYADTAYAILSRVLKNPRVTYAGDFSTVCEEVYYGRADCCILPVENSAEGALSAFRALIAKYELHTAARCVVERGEYDTAVFALLTKSMSYPGGGGETFFEIGFSPDTPRGLPDVLLAASCYGMSASRIDTVRTSSEYGDMTPSYDIAFRCAGADIDAFLCYLALAAPRSEPLGMYDLIR